MKLSTKLISDNDNRLQDSSVDKWRFVVFSALNTFLSFSNKSIEKTIIKWRLVFVIINEGVGISDFLLCQLLCCFAIVPITFSNKIYVSIQSTAEVN